jgi:hypothetical protein
MRCDNRHAAERLGGAARAITRWARAARRCLDTLVKICADETTKTRVRANLLDPGIVRTWLRARAFPGEDPSRLPPLESVADAFLALPECTRKRRDDHGLRRSLYRRARGRVN